MKNLKISKEISLPTEIVTQTVAILAKRRAGKSYTMRRICEQLLEANQQIVIVDPKGDQWGIRSSSDGKKPGFPIVILGGEHADVPLEVNAGEIVAKLVVEERVSILLDLSMFRKHEIATFMQIFLENLYRLKAREEYRTPVMLVVDEADAIAPQKPQKGEERMLGAIEDIVRRGGQRGIGCILVTQRSAVLNKNVLTQAQMLIVLRTIAPQDLAAMKAWIDVHGTIEQGKELMTSLPSLPIGDAWFWSPGWPTDAGIFQRSHILPITTFDSGATPKPGEKKITPKNLADVNLDALKKQMAATIEKQKADDPKALKKKIAELEKLLSTNLKSIDNKIVKPDVPMGVSQWMQYGAKYGYDKFFEKKISNEVGRRWLEALSPIAASAHKLKVDIAEVGKTLGKMNPVIFSTSQKINIDPLSIEPGKILLIPREDMKDVGEVTKGYPDFGSMGHGERMVLAAIAQSAEVGINRPHITVLTSYKKSTRDRYIQYLQQKEFVRAALGKLFVTPSGLVALGPEFEPLPTGADLRDHLLKTLPDGERRILAVLIGAHPEAVSREEITNSTGYQKSTRDRYLQYMAARELIEYPGQGLVKVVDKLFE